MGQFKLKITNQAQIERLYLLPLVYDQRGGLSHLAASMAPAAARMSLLCPLPSSPSSPPSSNIPYIRTLSQSPASRFQFRSLRSLDRFQPARATLAVDSPASDRSGVDSGSGKVLLEVKDLKAVIAETRQTVLRGINLTVREGEVHAIMGKNGSGKSTFSKVLVGHPDYEVVGGSVEFRGENLLEMDPEERSHGGLFMSFQSPIEIPGVSNIDFLQMACNARRKKRGLPELSPIEFFGFLQPKLATVNMDPKFLNRNVNEGFSGGEKKRNEILQLAVLEADLAILDEIDSGLDVDAMQDVAKAVNALLTPTNSVLMITHYRRLLDFVAPTFIHVMENGRIIRTGDLSLADQLEREGYRGISAV
ncbi:non-intrinsic ABC protein 7 [Wolffia australiana]